MFRRTSPSSLTSAVKPSSIHALAAYGGAEIRGQKIEEAVVEMMFETWM